MAETDILVSEMTPASQINTDDLMIMTQPDAQAETGYTTKRGTVLQVANKMLKGTEYSTDLPDFTDKTPLGGLEELKADIKALLPIGSASGNPCNFSTDISDELVSLTAEIVASGGGGTPDNPIPIVGYSELNLTRCGVNIVSDYEVNAGRSIYQDCLWLDCELVPNTTYTLSLEGTNGNRFYTNGELFTNAIYKDISGRTFVEVTTKSSISKSTPQQYTNGYGWRVLKNAKNQDEDNTFTNVQLELGSTATAYEPYNGQTFTVAFGQTVYGGVYDKSGRLTITHAIVDLGTLAWSNATAGGTAVNAWARSATIASQIKKTTDNNSTVGCICSVFTEKSANAVYVGNNNCVGINTSGDITIYATDFTDYTAEQSASALSGQMLVYPLATPIVIDVQAVSVSAVVGTNNIVSDCIGDVNVQYRDSIQHYIDSKIASVQALIL